MARSTTTQIPRRPGKHVASVACCLALIAGCDAKEGSGEECPSDLPADWNCANPVSLETDSVELCAQIYEDPVPEVGLEAEGELAFLMVTGVVFRDEQEICAYTNVEETTTRVLLQPCEMHPTSTIKTSCVYGFTVSLGDLPPEITHVDVLRRYDFMSDEIPPVVELGSVSVP